MKFYPNLSIPILAILLLFVTDNFAQNTSHFCGTEITEKSLSYTQAFHDDIKFHENEFMAITEKTKKSGTHKNTLPAPLNSIPVKAFIIRPSSGHGGLNIDDLHKAINDLNTLYADAFMEFFLCDGVEYIDNDDYYYKFNRTQETDVTESYYTPGVINIYFTDYVEVTTGVGLCGYSNTFGGSDVIVMNNTCATNGTSLAHEIGHFFSLMHTHGPDNHKLTTELVDGSNCDTDGDMICDTPADPGLSIYNVNTDCEYTGSIKDTNGDLFQPDTENIMSYSRSSCKSHFSQQQLARMYAFYKSARQYLSCPSTNVNFTADNFQACEDELTVNFTDLSVGATSWQWDVDGDNEIDYVEQHPTHTFTAGIYDVTLTITTASSAFKNGDENTKSFVKTISKTFSQIIKVGTHEDTTMDVDFDTFGFASSDGWSAIDVSGHGFNWLINSAETVSTNTGPMMDKTSGERSGNYIYTEASGSKEGDVAEFVSPCISINEQNTSLDFYYHMFGDHIGELHIDIETNEGYVYDVIPAIKGAQQINQDDDFVLETVNLSRFYGETINIHFRAVRGKGWAGDIAIDGIRIKGNSVVQKSKNTSTLKLFPNPVTNNIINIVSTSEKPNPKQYYTISNLVGQVFLKGSLLDHQQINVSKLPKGSYLITVINGKNVEVKQFIK
ncbi:T9SS type A sorting domain-containing protein [Hyunsoonleella ulvae]|uniref:T9SS type A sorting domain-containing protein n=1 Tax=Hyunsoonleella ulvae TaxID=2799948 RepID=UPI0019399822|nr:T9SS type A sorting domain-containing protein [Hyunsoonleella ulvae]